MFVWAPQNIKKNNILKIQQHSVFSQTLGLMQEALVETDQLLIDLGEWIFSYACM